MLAGQNNGQQLRLIRWSCLYKFWFENNIFHCRWLERILIMRHEFCWNQNLVRHQQCMASLSCQFRYKLFLLLWLILIQQYVHKMFIFEKFCVFFVAHLHNQFLLAILTKCQSLGSSVCKYISILFTWHCNVVVFSEVLIDKHIVYCWSFIT